MDIVKIAVLGIAGVFLAIPLKREKGEYSTFVAMVVGICIFIYLLTKVETVLLFVDSIKSQLPIDASKNIADPSWNPKISSPPYDIPKTRSISEIFPTFHIP